MVGRAGTRGCGKACTGKDFCNPHTFRTRKRSEQAVQFFGTVKFARTPIPRYPPPLRPGRSFFLPIPPSFSAPNPYDLTRAPTLNTGPPAIVTEPESFADRSCAEETLPTFLLLLFVRPHPPSLLPPPFPPPIFFSLPNAVASFSTSSFTFARAFFVRSLGPPFFQSHYRRLLSAVLPPKSFSFVSSDPLFVR